MNMCIKAVNDFSNATKNLKLCVLSRNGEIVGKISGYSSLSGKNYYVSTLIYLSQYHGGYAVHLKSGNFERGIYECFMGLKEDLQKIGLELDSESLETDFTHELARFGFKIEYIC